MGIGLIIAAAVAGGEMIGGAIIGNQQKQKAKGQAGQIERDATAAQDAADLKLRQSHDQDILMQSQAGAIARARLETPWQRPATLLSPVLSPRPLSPLKPNSPTPSTPPFDVPQVQPIDAYGRKTLLGA